MARTKVLIELMRKHADELEEIGIPVTSELLRKGAFKIYELFIRVNELKNQINSKTPAIGTSNESWHISSKEGTPISHYEMALAAHNAGKKVRRKSWPEGMVLETATRAKHKHGELYDANLTKISNCSMVDITIADCSAADWEIIDD